MPYYRSPLAAPRLRLRPPWRCLATRSRRTSPCPSSSAGCFTTWLGTRPRRKSSRTSRPPALQTSPCVRRASINLQENGVALKWGEGNANREAPTAVQDLRDYYIVNNVNWDYLPLPTWFLMLTAHLAFSGVASEIKPELRSRLALGKAKKVCMGYNNPCGFGCKEAKEGCKYKDEGGHVCVLCNKQNHGLYFKKENDTHTCPKMRKWQAEVRDLEQRFGLRDLTKDDPEGRFSADMQKLIRLSVQRAPAPAPKTKTCTLKKSAAANSWDALGQSSSSESESESETEASEDADADGATEDKADNGSAAAASSDGPPPLFKEPPGTPPGFKEPPGPPPLVKEPPGTPPFVKMLKMLKMPPPGPPPLFKEPPGPPLSVKEPPPGPTPSESSVEAPPGPSSGAVLRLAEVLPAAAGADDDGASPGRPPARWRWLCDLEPLLECLPGRCRAELALLGVGPAIQGAASQDRLAVGLRTLVLDDGLPPRAQVGRTWLPLSQDSVTQADLSALLQKTELVRADYGAIKGTLHRVAATRAPNGEVNGVTVQVGRALVGAAELVRDVLLAGPSVIIVGPPGAGKTTLLRDAARLRKGR